MLTQAQPAKMVYTEPQLCAQQQQQMLHKVKEEMHVMDGSG